MSIHNGLELIDHFDVVGSGRRSRIAWNLRSFTELILPTHSSWHWPGPSRVTTDSPGWHSTGPRAPGVLAYLAVGLGLLEGNDIPSRNTRLAGSCPGVPGGLGGLMWKSDLLTVLDGSVNNPLLSSIAVMRWFSASSSPITLGNPSCHRGIDWRFADCPCLSPTGSLSTGLSH
ncbi:hypothetical protein H5410_005254 [Solanum commersonii]|uniref:Uncharacterized protein n=1 Tax=Solanum commersonii TaxID=4109 RepID=A0A9J6A730_SOLCO|nr:hypothetical protein H5410_005254 [Solanum commersonii]